MASPVKTQQSFKPDYLRNKNENINECDEKIVNIIHRLRAIQGLSVETREDIIYLILNQKETTEVLKLKVKKLSDELQNEINIRNDLLLKLDETEDRLQSVKSSRNTFRKCLNVTACVIAVGGIVILLSILPPELLDMANATHQVATSIILITNS